MATQTKKRTQIPAVKVSFKGAYPETYYTTVGGRFLPRVKFMKDAAKERIARDISKATAESVAAILASSAPTPPPPPAPPIAGGGSTGDNGRMEARLKDLELDMRDVRDRLARVEIKVDGLDSRMDRLEKKVDGLPSKDFVESKVSASANKIIIWIVGALVLTQIIPKIPDLLKALTQ